MKIKYKNILTSEIIAVAGLKFLENYTKIIIELEKLLINQPERKN
jgi:hypothetical protein